MTSSVSDNLVANRCAHRGRRSLKSSAVGASWLDGPAILDTCRVDCEVILVRGLRAGDISDVLATIATRDPKIIVMSHLRNVEAQDNMLNAPTETFVTSDSEDPCG
jgi:hypothetical protein